MNCRWSQCGQCVAHSAGVQAFAFPDFTRRRASRQRRLLSAGQKTTLAADGLARQTLPVLAAPGGRLRFSCRRCSPPSTPCSTSAIPAPPRSGSASSGFCRCSARCSTSRSASTASAAAPSQLGVHKTFSRAVPENLGEPEHDGAEHLKHARPRRQPRRRPAAHRREIKSSRSSTATPPFPPCSPPLNPRKNPSRSAPTFSTTTRAGKQFVAALDRAVQRGVAVRVLD